MIIMIEEVNWWTDRQIIFLQEINLKMVLFSKKKKKNEMMNNLKWTTYMDLFDP